MASATIVPLDALVATVYTEDEISALQHPQVDEVGEPLGPPPEQHWFRSSASVRKTVTTPTRFDNELSVFNELIPARGGCVIADTAKRAIELTQLSQIVDHVKRRVAAREIRVYPYGSRVLHTLESMAEVTLYTLNECVILPATESSGCSMVELMAAGEQEPDYFGGRGERIDHFLVCLEQHNIDRMLSNPLSNRFTANLLVKILQIVTYGLLLYLDMVWLVLFMAFLLACSPGLFIYCAWKREKTLPEWVVYLYPWTLRRCLPHDTYDPWNLRQCLPPPQRGQTLFAAMNFRRLFCVCCYRTESNPAYLGSSREPRYWVCAYANRQHDLSAELADGSDDLTQTSFYRAMMHSKGTVSLLDGNGKSWSRIWCVFELWHSLVDQGDRMQVSLRGLKDRVDTARSFDVYTAREDGSSVGICSGQAAVDRSDTEASERQREFPLNLLALGVEFKVEDGQSSIPEDKERILKGIGSNAKQLERKVHGIMIGVLVAPALDGGELDRFIPLMKEDCTELDLNLLGNNGDTTKGVAQVIEALDVCKSFRLVSSIDRLPSCIGKLTQLTKLELVLENWELSDHELPDELGDLCSLTELSLDILTSWLPDSIGNLAALRLLNIKAFWLLNLPASMGQLCSLEELSLDCPSLTSLPSSFSGVKSLAMLHLVYCPRLTKFPDLSMLPRLTSENGGPFSGPWGLGLMVVPTACITTACIIQMLFFHGTSEYDDDETIFSGACALSPAVAVLQFNSPGFSAVRANAHHTFWNTFGFHAHPNCAIRVFLYSIAAVSLGVSTLGFLHVCGVDLVDWCHPNADPASSGWSTFNRVVPCYWFAFSLLFLVIQDSHRITAS